MKYPCTSSRTSNMIFGTTFKIFEDYIRKTRCKTYQKVYDIQTGYPKRHHHEAQLSNYP